VQPPIQIERWHFKKEFEGKILSRLRLHHQMPHPLFRILPPHACEEADDLLHVLLFFTGEIERLGETDLFAAEIKSQYDDRNVKYEPIWETLIPGFSTRLRITPCAWGTLSKI